MRHMILENHPADSRVKEADVFQTLSARMGTGGGNVPLVVEIFDLQAFGVYGDTGCASTVLRRDYKGVTDIVTDPKCRRITPLETGRLQGFPDWWAEDGSDSDIYKMWGNGIALPCAYDVMRRIANAE